LADPRNEIRNREAKFTEFDPEKIQNKWFKETMEIKDDDDESYTDIKIPDFKDGRQGRFIHDFKKNQTTIIDESVSRCFVYPLDYTSTLPPRNMIDMMIKLHSGYYFPNTINLRKKMRVLLPALDENDDYVSSRTAYVCNDMKIYKLEPFVSGVYKRSIAAYDEHAKFAEFGGNGIIEYDIVNFDEIKQYEMHHA
jgi:integral membrane protein 2B